MIRPSTPIKTIINYDYSKQHELEIFHTYSNFMTERSKEFKLEAKSTRHFDNLLSLRKNKVVLKDKPLYKMKKFLKIDSKVKEQINNFKTYLPVVKNNKRLENLIKQTENEINLLNKETSDLV